MKKLLLGLGAIGTIITPIALVVSCSKDTPQEQDTFNLKDLDKQELESLLLATEHKFDTTKDYAGGELNSIKQDGQKLVQNIYFYQERLKEFAKLMKDGKNIDLQKEQAEVQKLETLYQSKLKAHNQKQDLFKQT